MLKLPKNERVDVKKLVDNALKQIQARYREEEKFFETEQKNLEAAIRHYNTVIEKEEKKKSENKKSQDIDILKAMKKSEEKSLINLKKSINLFYKATSVFNIITFNGNNYVYNKRKRTWWEYDPTQMIGRVRYIDPATYGTNTAAKELVDYIETAFKEGSFKLDIPLLDNIYFFENGYVNITDSTLTDDFTRNKEDWFTPVDIKNDKTNIYRLLPIKRIAYNYNENLKVKPEVYQRALDWLKWIGKGDTQDMQNALLMMGLVINGIKSGKFWVIQGRPESGKTTFMSLIKSFLTQQEIAGTPVENLDKPFQKATLMGKKLLLNEEGPATVVPTKILKELCDPMSFIQLDFKHQQYQPYVNIHINTVIVTNHITQFQDTEGLTDGRRLVIQHYPFSKKVLPPEDLGIRMLEEKEFEQFILSEDGHGFNEEIKAIFLDWAMIEVHRWIQRGKTWKWSIWEQEAIETNARSINSVIDFYDSFNFVGRYRQVIDAGLENQKTEFFYVNSKSALFNRATSFSLYTAWCKKANRKPYGSDKFFDKFTERLGLDNMTVNTFKSNFNGASYIILNRASVEEQFGNLTKWPLEIENLLEDNFIRPFNTFINNNNKGDNF